MFSRVIKPALLVLASFALVWGAVYVYWQSTARMPSTGDVVGWLLAAPLALVLTVWGVSKVRASVAADASSPTPKVAAKGQAAAGGARAGKASSEADKTDAAEGRFRVTVLASSLRSPGGATVEELAAAVAEGKGVGPDPELKNDAGFPIFAARIADIEVDELRDDLADMPLAKSAEIDVAMLADDRLRSIQAMSETLTDLLPHADELMLATEPQSAADNGNTQRQRIAVEAPVLRISLLLPGGWTEHERLLAAQWLQHACATESPAHAWSVDYLRNDSGATAWTVLDRISLALNREPQKPALWIVLAAESAISDACVAQWEARGTLFSTARRNGLMPGEASAGLLLTGAKDVRFAKADAAQVARPVFGQLESSADASTVSRATVLGALAGRLAEASAVEVAAIEWVVSDADHRASRVTEVARLLQDRLPHVAFDENNLSTGITCGHMGAASELVGLALACYLAKEHQKQVMVASVSDPFARGALLVGMPAPPAESAVSA
ncbi:hypothetical protein [Variovorax rhizosphaerae]|uniref:3-oxoacyl-ACP synthase n=1 Tax=Variovorax rhizosphaerae TaxID=1836200 RepID=A0ABU8WGX9_9BURK